MDVRQGFTVEGGKPLDDALAFAADHGFDFVELNMEGQFARSRVDSASIRETAERYGVDLVVHLPFSPDPGSPHEHVRAGAVRELEACIDAAIEMGADRGVFHATTYVRDYHWSKETVADALCETIRHLTDHARERGFTACVENLKGPFFDAGDFRTLLDRTDGGLCLDTGHAHATGHDTAWQAALLREHGERIAHVHLNDTRRPDEDEHLPVGVGDLDFDPLVAAMRETGWAGTCTHEVFSADLSPVRYGKDRFDALLASERRSTRE